MPYTRSVYARNHLRSAHGCTECGKEARGKSNRDTKDS